MPKVYLENLGCAKNQVDGEVILTRLKEGGYERTEEAEEADLIIVNSCGFIESAKKESLEVFFSLHERYPEAKIILAGCLSERYGREMELDEADGIFGNKDLAEILEFADRVMKGRRGVLIPSGKDTPLPFMREFNLSYPGSAYLKISEGCNHNCAYCAIPLIRGSLSSRSEDEVVKEAEYLIDRGTREICLVAQDLAAFGRERGEKDAFVRLMGRLSLLKGDFVLRMLYIHPDDFPLDLIPLVKERQKILPYFDIPFQHSDPKILRSMGRRGDRDRYTSLVRKIREELPDAVIRTTIMLGYPAEDEESFRDVKRFIEDAEFDWMGSFIYSREEGTKAYSLTNEKKHRETVRRAKEWQKELESIQETITSRRLTRFVGRTLPVLIEERVDDDLTLGRIYAEAPDVDGLTVVMGARENPGDVAHVKITRVNGVDLEGVSLA